MPPQSNQPQQIEPPKSSKIPNWIFIIIGFLLIGLGGYFLYQYLTTPFINPNQKPPATIQASDISNWKTYRNEEYGFEFDYPSSIYLIKISNKPEIPEMLLAINLPGDRKPYELIRSLSISIWDNSQKLSLLEWATANRNFSNFADPYIPNEDFKNLVIGDREAISFLWGGGADGKTVIINNEHIIILLSASASVGSPTDRVWQDFDQLLSTFKFIK
ncbi:MAG TPA: hypothetical protein VJB58_03230 [Candidatus Paceibacterota bacterium]